MGICWLCLRAGRTYDVDWASLCVGGDHATLGHPQRDARSTSVLAGLPL